ncbi:MAG: RNB domain-containing ribonuclease [Dehalococcoidia bacterium]|jgi:exoribonuclease-2
MLINIDGKGRDTLERIARRVMAERGFLPDFSAEALDQLAKMQEVHGETGSAAKDLRNLPWASIDNDDSLDLDQLTVAESLPDNAVRIRVAVADVDILVKKDTAIDEHARQNTTSIYTAGKTFPMLPERLSTGLTSLNFQEDRPAIVIDMVVDGAGEIQSPDIYLAVVHNYAKLAYSSVGAWLEGTGPVPDAITAVTALADNLRIQDRVAQTLKARRHEHGALDLQTLEARPVFEGDVIKDLQAEAKTRATELIEDFMIAANDVTARFLGDKQVPSLRRVVRVPKRWDRIVEIAAQLNYQLPAEPDSKALNLFLTAQKAANPVAFPDLSLSIIKLLGSGEYVVELPNETVPGHFGLAVQDYTHSTAPNRRFPDLITQRILKATLGGSPMPYNQDELVELAAHCTQKEDDAKKVERQVAKSAAAMLLSSRIGDQFDAICTGAADKGTWVRIFKPPIEGRLVSGFQGVDVGARLKVQLISIDVEKGFIDFKQA